MIICIILLGLFPDGCQVRSHQATALRISEREAVDEIVMCHGEETRYAEELLQGLPPGQILGVPAHQVVDIPRNH